MPGAARFAHKFWRFVGRQLSGFLIDHELKDRVGPGVGDKSKSATWNDRNTMSPFVSLYHLQWLSRQFSVVSNPVNRNLPSLIVGTKQILS